MRRSICKASQDVNDYFSMTVFFFFAPDRERNFPTGKFSAAMLPIRSKSYRSGMEPPAGIEPTP